MFKNVLLMEKNSKKKEWRRNLLQYILKLVNHQGTEEGMKQISFLNNLKLAIKWGCAEPKGANKKYFHLYSKIGSPMERQNQKKNRQEIVLNIFQNQLAVNKAQTKIMMGGIVLENYVKMACQWESQPKEKKKKEGDEIICKIFQNYGLPMERQNQKKMRGQEITFKIFLNLLPIRKTTNQLLIIGSHLKNRTKQNGGKHCIKKWITNYKQLRRRNEDEIFGKYSTINQPKGKQNQREGMNKIYFEKYSKFNQNSKN